MCCARRYTDIKLMLKPFAYSEKTSKIDFLTIFLHWPPGELGPAVHLRRTVHPPPRTHGLGHPGGHSRHRLRQGQAFGNFQIVNLMGDSPSALHEAEFEEHDWSPVDPRPIFGCMTDPCLVMRLVVQPQNRFLKIGRALKILPHELKTTCA